MDYFTVDALNSGVPEAANNIAGNPLYVDQDGLDYHLQLCSAAIDAGDPTYPFVNEPEPNGDRINLGAFGNTGEAQISDPFIVTNSIADMSYPEDSGPFLVADLDTVFSMSCPEDSLSFTATSDNPNIQAVIVGSEIGLTSSLNYFGSGNISVTAIDGSGLTVDHDFSVDITPVNDPPTMAHIPGISFPEDSSYTLDLGSFAGDVDNDLSSLGWTWEVLDAQPVNDTNIDNLIDMNTDSNYTIKQSGKNGLSKSGTFILVDPNDLQIEVDSTTHIATFTVTGDTSGVFTVTFTVFDPGGLSDTDTTLVNVLGAGDPPVFVNAISDLAFPEDSGPHVAAILDTIFSDPDPGKVFAYQSESDNPNIEVSTFGDSLVVNSVQDSSGTGNVVVTATDATGFSVSDSFFVTVASVNDPPAIRLPKIIFSEDSSYIFDLDTVVTDVDHDTTEISWSSGFPDNIAKSNQESKKGCKSHNNRLF
jgi:hypothetical protein